MSNVSINIPEYVISTIADEVKTILDYEELAESVATNLDADELISNVSRLVMEDMINDYIDYDRVLDNIRDDVYNQIDSNMSDNVNDAVWSLLNDFSPTNACGTGRAFMDAIQKTIVYLFEQETNVTWLIDKLGVDVKSNVDNSTEDKTEEPVGLFNPDSIGVYEVVRHIVDNYLQTDQSSDQSFLTNLQMNMWQVFTNSRESYIRNLYKGA